MHNLVVFGYHADAVTLKGTLACTFKLDILRARVYSV